MTVILMMMLLMMMMTNGSLTLVSKFYCLLITLITPQHGDASAHHVVHTMCTLNTNMCTLLPNHTCHHVHTIYCPLTLPTICTLYTEQCAVCSVHLSSVQYEM